MKKRILWLIAAGVLLTGCMRQPSSAALKDDETRRLIISDILNNHAYLKEFMDSMRTSDHARMMMRSDTAITNNLAHEMPAERMIEHLMAKVSEDSMACKMMCGAMMGHKKVVGTMLETLGNEGVVDKGCMGKKMGDTKQGSKAAHSH